MSGARDGRIDGARAKFCALVAMGAKSIKDCFVEAYPGYAAKGANTVNSQARRLVTRPEIVAEIARLKSEAAAKTEGRYAGLREEMVDDMVRGIREGVRNDPMTIVEFRGILDILCKMHGWYAPTDVTVRNGGVAADYRPPTLMEMTDEEISARLRELRGETRTETQTRKQDRPADEAGKQDKNTAKGKKQ